MKEKGELPADDDMAAIDAALMSDEMACVKEIYVYYPSDETREIAQNRANEAYSRLMSGEFVRGPDAGVFEATARSRCRMTRVIIR